MERLSESAAYFAHSFRLLQARNECQLRTPIRPKPAKLAGGRQALLSMTMPFITSTCGVLSSQLLLGLLASVNAVAEGANSSRTWEVDGEISAAGKTNYFTVQVSESGSWHMRASVLSPYPGTIELACDGTNHFGLSYKSGGAVLIGKELKRYQDSAYLYPGTVPRMSEMLAGVWWLFCAPYHLGFTGETNCPAFFRDIAPNDSAQLFCRQALLRSDELRFGMQQSSVFLARPATGDEHPVYRLTVSDFGQTNGMLYPLTAVMERYNIVDLDSRGLPKRVVSYTIRCNPAKLIPEPQTFYPVVSQVTSFLDSRIPPNKQVEYVANAWKSLQEVQDLIAAGQVKTVGSGARNSTRRSHSVWIILAIVAAGILLLGKHFWSTSRRLDSQTVKQNKNT